MLKLLSFWFIEFEALGDDFVGGAPDPSTNVPGGSKEDSVKLDEFGLPVLNS